MERDNAKGGSYRVLDELRVIEGLRVATGVGHFVGDYHRVGAVITGFECS